MKEHLLQLARGAALLCAGLLAMGQQALAAASSPAATPLPAQVAEESTSSNLPQNGKTYYIYCDNATQQFFYNNGGTLAVSNGLTNDPSLYTFTCTVTSEGKYQFLNTSNNKYFGFKAFSASAYSYTISNGYPSGVATHLYGDANGRYLVMKEDGGFDQSSNANYTKDDNNIYSANFIFVDVETCKTLSISANAGAGASVTWNGTTKTLPCSFLCMPGTEVSDPTLTLSYDDATLAAATLKYEGIFASDGTETSLPSTYEGTADAFYEVRFMPDVFSSTYGEKWVRVVNVRKPANGFTLPGNTAGQIATNTIDPSSLDHLWCFVGNYKSFKIYSHTSESLVITHDGTPAQDEAVSLAAESSTSTAQSWTLADYTGASSYPGYSIEAVSKSGQGLNPHGGIPRDLRFYSSTDAGSRWTFPVVDADTPITLSADVTGTAFEGNPVANITITSAGSTLTFPIRQTESNPTGSIAETRLYLYKNKPFTAASYTYRGFNCEARLNGSVTSSLTDLALTEGLSLCFSYTANEDRILFTTPDANGKPYRIPAIATALNGDVIAISDNRPCGSDIGYGEVDIKARISTDNGLTWGDEFFLFNGHGNGSNITFDYAFGDAAVVADRESNKVLVLAVCGKTVCWNGNYIPDSAESNPNRVAKVVGTYDDATKTWQWTTPVEVTEDIYSLFVSETNGVKTATVKSLFVGSGRIMQSRVVKKGDYYRLYAAVWTKNEGNRVIYSDDFGTTWNVLGTIADRPASGGDEPKCEELPDGTVILSSRRASGRVFNLFTFASTTGADAYTTGTWGTAVNSNSVTGGLTTGDSGTNGEIYMLKGVMDKSTGLKKDIMLQSVPNGPGRNNVSIWYKVIDSSVTYTPTTFSQGWTFGKQISFRGSAYSTMALQADGRIGFLFEEEPGGYCIIYCPITIDEVTGDLYTFYRKEEALGIGAAGANKVLAKTGPGYPTATSAARATLQSAIDAALTSASDDTDATLATLATAVTAYKSATTEIQLPEDGKAYTFANVTWTGVKRYLKYENATNGMKYSATGVDDATVFVCRALGQGKFAFVCNDGKYLIWRGRNVGGNGIKGYCDYFNQPFSDTHSATVTDPDTGESSTQNVTETMTDWPAITLAKMTAGGQVSGSPDNLFGYLTFRGRRIAYAGNGNEFAYTVLATAGTYDQASEPYFNANFTSAILMEEATYPNTLSLTAVSESDTYIKGITPGSTICTFSAPFPTVIPEGVKAYYASDTEDGAKMNSVATPALPANQGVVLVGPAGFTTGVMLPAAGEEEADLSQNLFAHTAAAPHELVEGDYILANSTYGLAFYKGRPGSSLRQGRAYLPAALTTSADRAFTLIFDGVQEAIDTVELTGDTQAAKPVYDLAGRRVISLTKGGIYISEGRKFIAR